MWGLGLWLRGPDSIAEGAGEVLRENVMAYRDRGHNGDMDRDFVFQARGTGGSVSAVWVCQDNWVCFMP